MHNGVVMSRYGLSDLQIFLKNDGDRTAVASGVEMSVKDVWRLRLQFSLNFFQDASHEYSVELDPTRSAPYTLTIPISQSLKGDESDRVNVSIGLNPMKPFENIYHISVRLLYNTDQKTNETDVVLVLPDEGASDRSYFLGEYRTEMDAMAASQKANEDYRRKHKVKKESLDLVSMFRDDKKAAEIDHYNRDLISRAAQVKGKRNARASALIARASAP
jgi:hypothetical protein